MSERLNIFWFLSLLAPALIMYFSIQKQKGKTSKLGVFASLIFTYTLCVLAVSRKWELRVENAITPEQMERATADGANLVFAALVSAPFEAILWTTLWWLVWNKPKNVNENTKLERGKRPNCCIEIKDGLFKPENVLKEIVGVLPPKSYLCFEGTGINDEVMKFYRSKNSPTGLMVTKGTLWPRSDVFHIPINKTTVATMCRFFSKLPIPEICDHFVAYHKKDLLVEAHDFGSNAVFFHDKVPEKKIRKLASKLRGSYVEFRR